VLNEEFGRRVIIGISLTCKTGGKRNNINNNSIQYNSRLYYLCVDTTATRSITEAEEENKKNTKYNEQNISRIKEKIRKSHLRIAV